MPSKVKKTTKKSSVRPARVAKPARRTSSKTSKTTRSLNVRRQKSSSLKSKANVSRRSVVLQSASRPSLKASAAKIKSARRSSLSTSVYNTKGKVVGKVTLPAEIFGAKINDKLMSQAVRVYLANQRQGTSKTKSRGEVNLTTAKIYRQKGTGRARHGAKSAPIFVGGGVAFGPKPRDFSLKLPKKMRRLSLFSALSSKLKDNEIKVLSGFEKMEPKTKIMATAIKNLDSKNKKILLVVPQSLVNIQRAARNIEGVKISPAEMLNTYEVLDTQAILILKDSIGVLSKHFLTEGKN